MMQYDKTDPERRNHTRYRVDNGVFAIDSTRFGKVLDISLGGLSFTCINPEGWTTITKDTGILLGNDDLCLDQIPFQIASVRLLADKTAPGSMIEIRRYSLKFGEMNDNQVIKLKNYIVNNTNGVA